MKSGHGYYLLSVIEPHKNRYLLFDSRAEKHQKIITNQLERMFMSVWNRLSFFRRAINDSWLVDYNNI